MYFICNERKVINYLKSVVRWCRVGLILFLIMSMFYSFRRVIFLLKV